MENARILVCGGDGTIGWVLAELDAMGLSHRGIPVGTVPLGTGNDMARALKVGGGYEGENVKKLLDVVRSQLALCVASADSAFLCFLIRYSSVSSPLTPSHLPFLPFSLSPFATQVLESLEVKLDRWSLDYIQDKNDDLNASIPASVPLSYKLPLTVCNNYFSFGSDAWAALSFHLARERDPAKFNSRIHNKAFYGIQGAKDIFRRKFKNLSSMVELKVGGSEHQRRC